MFIHGSRTSAMRVGSGSSAGESTAISPPSVSSTRYSTEGAVASRSSPYSRSSRSCTMSMCSRPRKPARNPGPSAADCSGWYCSDASLSCSFSRASRSSS